MENKFYNVIYDTKTGKPANGTYFWKLNDGIDDYEETYENGFKSSYKRSGGYQEEAKYEVGKYNSVITYYHHSDANNEETTYYHVYKDDENLKTKELEFNRRLWCDLINTSYLSKSKKYEYDEDNTIKSFNSKDYNISSDDDNHYVKLTKEVSVEKNDDKTYHVVYNRYNANSDPLIKIEFNCYNEYTHYFLFLFKDCVKDITATMYYDDKTPMLLTTKVKDDIYRTIFFNKVGEEEIVKYLSLEDTASLLEKIEHKYYNFELDYKQVYEIVKNIEQELLD